MDNTKVVVEDGVNNKNVRLTWTFVLESSETLVVVRFSKRRRGGLQTEIASGLKDTSFSFSPNTDYDKHHKANIDSELALL